MKKRLIYLVTSLLVFAVISMLFGISYDLFDILAKYILSILIALIFVNIVDVKTEIIYPINNYTMRLISKEIIMHSGVSKSSTGIFVRYEFVFEDEKGDQRTYRGKEELYFFIMEDNIVNIDVKNKNVLKFELLSVDGGFSDTN